ncbi:MAG: RagB/SusD family nutrient uptake outer membrane protein [Flavobacterium sp.]|nr:MAG: RagB/SusD family nutrient uptake outer membrane protein [Flavobacterium sp.]
MLLLIGCDSFVEVDMPTSQLTSQGVFQSTATANAAMAYVYAGLRDNGIVTGSPTGISSLMGGYADEMDYYGLAGTSLDFFFNNSLLATEPQVSTLWSVSYNQIYAANSVIEGVGAASPIPQADKDRLKGEALFVRAWLHFYLANLYGGIPYITTTDYAVNSAVSRLSVEQVYAQVRDDLEQSLALLPETAAGFGRTKPDKWAAQAFLARVYLYSGQWAEASNAASAVLNNTALFGLNPNLNDVFSVSSNETIWKLAPISGTANTLEAATFIFLAGPPPNMALTTELMNSFEPNDGREAAWTKAITNGSEIWYHAFKYKQQGISSFSMENSVMMRIGEIYLIRAEARARQGELTGAKEDLDAVRLRAGLVATTVVGQQAILDAVLQERRVELFTEMGHRFFDLKRFGIADAVLGAVKPNWDATDVLLPIPETELLRNPNLGSQNPGY